MLASMNARLPEDLEEDRSAGDERVEHSDDDDGGQGEDGGGLGVSGDEGAVCGGWSIPSEEDQRDLEQERVARCEDATDRW